MTILKGLTLQNIVKGIYVVEDMGIFPILIEKLIRILQKYEMKMLTFHVRQDKITYKK